MTRFSVNPTPVSSDESAAIASPVGSQFSSQPIVLQFEQARVKRGEQTVWSNLNLTVHAGEFIAVLGPNGAGKSTLLKVLLGLLPLTQGRSTILGKAVRRGNRAVGYLPQRRSFETDVHIRGRDLVRLGLDGALWGLPLPVVRRLWHGQNDAREAQRRVQSVIDLVGATAYADRPIGTLSGGEQQRLLIAQAIVTHPRILLLDEPLDSLDLRNQQAIAALVHRICRDYQMTVLLVAHDINPILPYIDRVLYIARGQTAIGTPADVITSDTLSSLYDAAVEVLQTRDGRIVVVGQPEAVSYHASSHAR